MPTKKKNEQPNQFHALTKSERRLYRKLEAESKTVSDRIGPVYVPSGTKVSVRMPCMGSMTVEQVKPGPGYAEFSRLLEEMSKLRRLAVERCGNFVFCTVEWESCCLLVTFEDESTLLLQSDFDQASFCDSCGLFQHETKYDSVNNPDWADCDPTNIWYCPDDYIDQAHETDHEWVEREHQKMVDAHEKEKLADIEEDMNEPA